MKWPPWKRFGKSRRDLDAMTPNGVYAILLQELPLPGWLENVIREPLGSLDWRLTFEQRDDYTGSYHFWLLDNLAGRTALLHISADVLEKAFGRIGDLAGRMSSLRAADQLFVFCDAPPVPPDKMAEKDNWFPQGKVMFCLAPQIDRLRSTVDPGERKSLLRNWLDVPPAPSPTAPASAVDRVILDDATREMVVAVLARASEKQIAGIRQYFALLLDRSGLQGAWVEDARMKFVVSADTDARILVDMAAGEGSRGAPAGYTVLGHLLKTALPYMPGLREESTLVAILLLDGLITSGTAEQELRTKYAVPTWGGPVAPPQDIGPDIVWFGPPDIEFQSYEQRAPLLRLDDLPKCLEQGGSVCLITVGNTKATGTGFLIAPDLVLTNCHVLLRDWRNPEKEQAAEARENARSVTFRFRFIRGDADEAAQGLEFKSAVKDPLVRVSPVRKLDYALLRMEKPVTGIKGLQPASYVDSCPAVRSALHIVQHPQGGVMSVDFNVNGVTGTDPKRGLVQYVTRAAPGSSGSPCFNSDWKVVGIHHAERTRIAWCIREGIMLGAILNEIRNELPNTPQSKEGA